MLLYSYHVHSRPTRILIGNGYLVYEHVAHLTATSAYHDICWPDLDGHVNRFLHGVSRRPERGVSCGCVCFYTQQARIRFGFGKGKINTSNERTYRSKTAYSYCWCKLKVFFHVAENFNRHVQLMASLFTQGTQKLFRSVEVVAKRSRYRAGQALKIQAE